MDTYWVVCDSFQGTRQSRFMNFFDRAYMNFIIWPVAGVIVRAAMHVHVRRGCSLVRGPIPFRMKCVLCAAPGTHECGEQLFSGSPKARRALSDCHANGQVISFCGIGHLSSESWNCPREPSVPQVGVTQPSIKYMLIKFTRSSSAAL